MIQSIVVLFERDLDKVIQEIASYTNPENIWRIDKSISNSAGNLALHLCGNLKHFIGAVLGENGYVRDREAEFSESTSSREVLISNLQEAKEVVLSTLPTLTQKQLADIYPREVFGQTITTEYFIIHLLTHLNYHLGQINYHRRLLDN